MENQATFCYTFAEPKAEFMPSAGDPEGLKATRIIPSRPAYRSMSSLANFQQDDPPKRHDYNAYLFYSAPIPPSNL
jgi:hypothetical protein